MKTNKIKKMIQYNQIINKCLQNKPQSKYTYIPYRSYLNQENSLNTMKNKGFKFIGGLSKTKKILGISCLIIAVFPNGLFGVFFPLSCFFLSISIIDLKQMKEKGLRKAKYKIRSYLKCKK